MINPTLQRIGELGLLPVVTIHDAKHAVPLGRALLAAGLPLVEITFRTDAAEEVITQLNANLPEMLVGAGTIVSMGQADHARKVGARFISTPGFDLDVAKYCKEYHLPILPGIATPTEIQMALEHDLEVMKFFPAESFGGVKTIQAMSGPFPQVRFVPTGGLNAGNLAAYVKCPNVLACGGTWVVKAELIDAENFAEITRLIREALDIVRKRKS